MIIANASALSAAPVVFVSFLSIIVLLCVRAWSGIVGATMSRFVSRTLDGSIVLLFLLFVVLVIFRFKTIG